MSKLVWRKYTPTIVEHTDLCPKCGGKVICEYCQVPQDPDGTSVPPFTNTRCTACNWGEIETVVVN